MNSATDTNIDIHRRKILLVILPVVLILTMSALFYLATFFFGENIGYLTGFAFYYFFWCIFIPLKVSGLSFVSFFINDFPLLRRRNWWIFLLFASTLIAPVFMFFIPKLPTVVPAVILLSVPLSVLHGHSEEMFWRGLYIKSFPDSKIWSIFIPSLFFTLWHIAPQFSIRSEHPLVFLISTIPLGVTYALVSFVTKSAKWAAIGHTVSTFLAFSLPISMCLYNVIK